MTIIRISIIFAQLESSLSNKSTLNKIIILFCCGLTAIGTSIVRESCFPPVPNTPRRTSARVCSRSRSWCQNCVPSIRSQLRCGGRPCVFLAFSTVSTDFCWPRNSAVKWRRKSHWARLPYPPVSTTSIHHNPSFRIFVVFILHFN